MTGGAISTQKENIMRFFRLVPFLAVPALFMACDRAPVAPDIDSPLFRATHGGFVVENEEDYEEYVSCANDGLGEVLHWSGPYRVHWTTVTSNSGNELRKFKDYEYLEGYSVVGLTSGDEWTFQESRVNNEFHIQKNGNVVRTAIFNEWFENQDGVRMFIQTNIHVTLANGALQVLRLGVNACSAH